MQPTPTTTWLADPRSVVVMLPNELAICRGCAAPVGSIGLLGTHGGLKDDAVNLSKKPSQRIPTGLAIYTIELAIPDDDRGKAVSLDS